LQSSVQGESEEEGVDRGLGMGFITIKTGFLW
jgi:hypothetical protein